MIHHSQVQQKASDEKNHHIGSVLGCLFKTEPFHSVFGSIFLRCYSTNSMELTFFEWRRRGPISPEMMVKSWMKLTYFAC